MQFLCGTTQAAALTGDQYTSTLERLHSLIATNQIGVAKSEAAAIVGSDIGSFHADDSLLHAISQARGADPALLARIELTIAELRRGGASGPAPDEKLLQQVAAEQEVPELARGGDVTTPIVPDTPIMEQIARNIIRMFRWIGKKIVQILEWISDFFPRRRANESRATVGMRWIVFAVVALIVIGIVFLAVEVMRRARRSNADLLTSSAPLRSSRDDDPLSRGATEWERYAAQLAAEGRFREAIRAWFHAVLVTCYAAGVLHFRKGRTNWEYIASLPPSTTWRPELMRLTQRFEREWYGSEQSSSDAFEDCSAHARRILDALQSVERGAA